MYTAALIPYFDDPFGILSVAYEYFVKRITEPPDCILQYLWMMFWHIFWALCYVFRGYCMLKYRLDSAYLSGMFDPIVPDQPPPRKSMTVHCYTTGSDGSISSPNDLISFDTDGIPFILYSGADCIISNVRALFGDLKPMDVYVKTANGTERRERYVGTFTLQLPDDNGVMHSYKIPDAVYDPHTEYNILGVSYLCQYFGDKATSNDPKAKDGTRATTTTGGTISYGTMANMNFIFCITILQATVRVFLFSTSTREPPISKPSPLVSPSSMMG